MAENADSSTDLWELARAFLRLGFTAFGGPAAHLAMMEEEFVRRREWISHQELLDMIGAANLVPGPNSTEVAIHIGFVKGGVRGMFVAGACFIVPAAVLVALCAWGYRDYGALPEVSTALAGVKPVVVAVVAQALIQLAPKAITDWKKLAVALAVLLLAAFGAPELPLMFGAGALLSLLAYAKHREPGALRPLGFLGGIVAAMACIPVAWQLALHGRPESTAPNLFLYFLKIGSVLYGSGYVLLAFLQRDLVQSFQWLTQGQLLDAVAVGQFTPGPVFTTATFIGFLKAGPAGALAATLGIFLPSFLFVVIGRRLIDRMRSSAAAGGFLDGVNAAALALMGLVLGKLALDALRDGFTIGVFAISILLLIRYRVNSAALILAGAIAGIIFRA